MAKSKKGYKRCSIEGCRKKAVIDNRCKEHAEEKLPRFVSEEKILETPVSDIAKKIKVVEKSARASTSMGSAKGLFRNREDFLNDLCFEAGNICGKFNRLFEK